MNNRILKIVTDRGRFTIRPYASADETGVLACWKEVFGKEMPLNAWRWKYVGNPYGCQILLCLDEEEHCAALYGGIPFPFNWCGRNITMTHLMDNMSHPRYRGAGLFVQTAEAFFDWYGGLHASVYVYGFPGRLHFDIGVKKLRYQGIPNGVCYLTGTTQEIQDNMGFDACEIRPIADEATELNRLWETCRQHYPLSIVRDARFVAWRFGSHPTKTYDVLGYYQLPDKTLRGYAVLETANETACLVDWLAPAALDDNVDFLARIAGFLSTRRITRIKTWLPANHFLTQAALAVGMKDAPEPLGFIPTARICSSPFTFKWANENIYYTMADGDLF